MKLSVVIPTHNRADILKTCLQKLAVQEGVSFEVIVIDDGSTDGTPSMIYDFSFENPAWTDLKYFKQPPSHQGVARNRGVKEATGEIIVFIGDDIFVAPDFLQKHRQRHDEFNDENVVVLGYTTWDPALKINPYMKFLESSGWQFGYAQLAPGFVDREDRYKFFYTSNISMKKHFFEKEKFDEEFKVYGWEDIELGYRLQQKHGMKLYYEPAARTHHHHFLEESNLPKKMRAVGKSAVHFERLQPGVKVIPRGMKRVIIKAATHPVAVELSKLAGKPTYYKFKSWQEFFRGAKRA